MYIKYIYYLLFIVAYKGIYIETTYVNNGLVILLPMRNKMEPRSNKLKIPMEKVSAFYKYDRERDSGYLTDNSPASINNQLQFNFDEESVNEENTDVKSHFEIFDTDDMSDDCFEDEDEMADNINKEVECTMSLDRNISVPIPVVRRPSAPAPPINNEIDDGNISKIELFTSYRFQRESCRRNKWFFKPIGRRTISTQTPHRHSQIIQDCVSTLSDRFHPYDASVGRGKFYFNSSISNLIFLKCHYVFTNSDV